MARDFYLIAHECNSIKKLERAFQQKVNGIECDLYCDDDQRWWISHSGFFKTDLVSWLRYIGTAEKKYNNQLAVIIFDVKTAKPFAEVRKCINENLPQGLPHIYSTANIENAAMFKEIVPLLMPHEGIAIDEEDEPTDVAAFFKQIGARQCWYGNGITFIPINKPFHTSMQKALPISNAKAPFSKIYTWSVHRKQALRKYILEDQVDGIIVGLNSFLTKPVKSAKKIIATHTAIKMATRQSDLFA